MFKNLKIRTKQFALKIIRLVASLPRTREADIIGRQLLKAGTSVGANYRESNRSTGRARGEDLGRIVRLGSTNSVAEAHVFDNEGRLIASGRGVYFTAAAKK